MNPEQIIDQQAFRHRDGSGGVLHSVAVIRYLDPNYQVQVYSCAIGADGLPDFTQGGYAGPGKTFANVRQASRYFDELVNQQRGRWTFLDPEETLPFAVDNSTHAPIFEYVSGNSDWGLVRQHLAPCLFESVVHKFLSRLGGRLMRGHRCMTISLAADFLPIVLSLAISGVGEIRRNGVTLTEGQLNTMAQFVAVDRGNNSLYRTLGLLPDYAAAIGGSATALVL
ncbi:MAG: hypothetical protein BGP25_05220 [Lysobacterales bacterium 63-13]|nr:MAG: hypothetical protein BGP25_05220 [Xanthomonadales bacterium 63-13]